MATPVHPWLSLPALLARLDEALTIAVDAASRRAEGGAFAESYRGLYVGEEQVRKLLDAQREATPAAAPGSMARLIGPDGTELDPFDAAVTVLALAPELDLKYERVFGYLHDDLSRRSPTVALALDLFCTDLQARLAALDRFAPDAPLRSGRIVALGGRGPLLGRTVRLDPQWRRYLTGGLGLDERVAARCHLVPPSAAAAFPAAVAPVLTPWVETARAGGRVHAVLAGAEDALAPLARGLAAALARPLLHLPQVSAADTPLLDVLAVDGEQLDYAVQVDLGWTRGLDLAPLERAGRLVMVTVPVGRDRRPFEDAGYRSLVLR